MQPQLYIGTMSGTSIDAMDAVLASFESNTPCILSAATRHWSEAERALLHALCTSGDDEIERAGMASLLIADAQHELIATLLQKAGVAASEVIAIGSHGQTVRHCPAKGFSVQLNSPARLAIKSRIDVISDFRASDLALGGEGAPLTPAFHAGVFKVHDQPCYVLNLGGIANLTVLNQNHKVLSGFDTGPANTLLDLVCRKILQQPFDKDAKIASLGRVDKTLLNKLLTHPYFSRLPPKSTGREDFSSALIDIELTKAKLHPEYTSTLLRTLSELTVISVMDAVKNEMQRHDLSGGILILAGGGAKNPLLRHLFEKSCQALAIKITTCEDFGVDSQYLEALSFAWFAYLFKHGRPLDLGHASKATQTTIAGTLTPAPNGAYLRTLREAQAQQGS